MKGKCRPGRRRLCARGRPGHYEEELVVELLRREERCDMRKNGGRSGNRDRALSGNATKPCKKEGGRERMKVRIYEGFAFSLKHNVSHNRGYDIQPGRLFYFTVAILAPRNHYTKEDESRCECGAGF